MQFKFAFVAAALATLAVATPTPGGSSPPSSVCSTGAEQCCQSTTTVADAGSGLTALLGLLGVVVGDLTGLIGLQCTSVVGSACSSQAVCCTDNAIGGLISVGCIPISL